MDLTEPVLPAPSGARNVSGAFEFGLLATAETYREATAGEEYLRRIGFRRGVTSEWQEGEVVTRVTLYLFADARGAEDFTANQQRSLNDNFPRAQQEPLPDLMVGSLQTYVDEGTRIGAATFIQGRIAVEVYVFSSRSIDKARMLTLARQQSARLPEHTA
jgi:hypothetical protein